MTPFEQGRAAARAGQSMTQNPFPRNTPQYAEWEAGFRSAGGNTGKDDEKNEDGKGI